MKQEQDDTRNAEQVGWATSKPETTFEEMLNAIGDSLSDLASSDDREDGEDENYDEDDPVGGKHGENDQLGCVMGTISKPVPHRMERFRQKQMKLDKLTRPGCRDTAD